MTFIRIGAAVLIFSVVSLAACANMQRRVQYDNLDQVARDATGKELWEIEFGDQEVSQVRARLGKTATASLYCIRDNVNAQAYVPEGLSIAQERRRANNIRLLTERALVPVIKLRESEAHREILRSGCNHH